MLSEHNTQEEVLSAFHRDAEWWKLMIGYMEKEIQFITRLLNSNTFKGATLNLFEHLQQFKGEMETKTKETHAFKKAIEQYGDKLKGILECEEIHCDTYYLDRHKELKVRFEEHYKDFNACKTNVFEYLGSLM
jgi:hypothetical protein